MFDKTDSKLSSFISEAPPEDLSAIASQVFNRVGTLDQSQKKQFLDEIQRDPQAKRVLEEMHNSSR